MQSIESINPDIVRSYDIRGRVGQQLGPGDAHALGLAFAAAAASRGFLEIAVCRDGRLSSPDLEDALLDGLLAGGMHVFPVGLGPTPQLHYAVRAAGLDGGIMVTGSHNPRDQNGFKLLLDGDPVYGAALRELVMTEPLSRNGGRVCELRLKSAPHAQLDGAVGVKESYVRYLVACARDAPALNVVWDCGNGAMGAVIGSVTERLPGRHRLLNSRVDGRFLAHHPDPAVAENLRELQTAVREHRADLGIAFDGDGDRVGVVDSTGHIVWPDQLLLFLATEVLATRPHATIVGDVKSSRVLFDGVRDLGGRAVMAPSGYVLVREAMLREGAHLAGEMSGHILFSDCWHRTDDALYAAVRVLASIGRQDRSLTRFRTELPPTVATPELRLPCSERRKSAVMREVAERLRQAGAGVDTTDGLRVTTPEGWWLLRTSGTESKLTVRCEASHAEGLESLKGQLALQLRLSGIDSGMLP
ncbi:MAG TPA: phosphomannomutase/phosphoglucomutase [Steroidobacteraceae bacterium]|nr:phosphomannomutase/phosphoglucomutase [Steroidobacteraceae bacterium]